MEGGKVSLLYDSLSQKIKKIQMILNEWQKVNFINVLNSSFLYKHHFGSFFYVHVTREKLPKRRSYKKCAQKTFMKLTPVLLEGRLIHGSRVYTVASALTFVHFVRCSFCVCLKNGKFSEWQTFEEKAQGGDSQNFLCKFIILFIILGLKLWD